MSSGARADLVTDFAALVRWAREAGIAQRRRGTGSVRASGRGPQAIAALEAARALRTALRAMAEDLANGKAPVAGGRGRRSTRCSRPARACCSIERRSGAFTTRRQLVTTDAASLLVPVAESAAWLLEHGDSSLVRGCENPACILFFYDTTKNKRRRWCSMEGCGSRAKAAAYYRRTRGKESSGGGAEEQKSRTGLSRVAEAAERTPLRRLLLLALSDRVALLLPTVTSRTSPPWSAGSTSCRRRPDTGAWPGTVSAPGFTSAASLTSTLTVNSWP